MYYLGKQKLVQKCKSLCPCLYPRAQHRPFLPCPCPRATLLLRGVLLCCCHRISIGLGSRCPRPLPSGPPPLISTHHYFFFKDLFTIVRLLQLGVFILMGGVPHEAALHHRRLRHHLFCGRRQEAPLHAVQAANNIHSTWLPTPPPPRASCHHLFSQG